MVNGWASFDAAEAKLSSCTHNICRRDPPLSYRRISHPA